MRNRLLLSLLLPMLLGVSSLVLPSRALAGDGRIEINQTVAQAGGVTPGDGPGFPVTLSRPGSYVVTGDLESATGTTTLISVTASHVDLDLNGFTIGYCWKSTVCGTPGVATGILAVGPTNLTVRNGSVLNMPFHGISAGSYTRLDQVRAIGNRLDGARLGDASVVTRSLFAENGDSGVHMQSSTGGLVEHSIFRSNGRGLATGFQTGYRGNVFTGNNGGAEIQNNGTGIDLGGNVCGTNTVCP